MTDGDEDRAIRRNATKLLVVEGKNDKDAFRKHFGEEGNVQVISCKGKNKLAQFLRGLPIISGFESQIKCVVVVLDNDEDPIATETLAREAFDGRSKPHHFVAVPDVGANGMLEDLLLLDNVLPEQEICLAQFFSCASRTANGKSRMQAWLSIKAPGRMLGPAINENKVSVHGTAFAALLGRVRLALGN